MFHLVKFGNVKVTVLELYFYSVCWFFTLSNRKKKLWWWDNNKSHIHFGLILTCPICSKPFTFCYIRRLNEALACTILDAMFCSTNKYLLKHCIIIYLLILNNMYLIIILKFLFFALLVLIILLFNIKE